VEVIEELVLPCLKRVSSGRRVGQLRGQEWAPARHALIAVKSAPGCRYLSIVRTGDLFGTERLQLPSQNPLFVRKSGAETSCETFCRARAMRANELSPLVT
jgi:hypothetical protein